MKHSVRTIALGLSLMVLATPGAASVSVQDNHNTTIQMGQVNINRTAQCGESNTNSTYQQGRININQTAQGGCGAKGPRGHAGHRPQAGLDHPTRGRPPHAAANPR